MPRAGVGVRGLSRWASSRAQLPTLSAQAAQRSGRGRAVRLHPPPRSRRLEVPPESIRSPSSRSRCPAPHPVRDGKPRTSLCYPSSGGAVSVRGDASVRISDIIWLDDFVDKLRAKARGRAMSASKSSVSNAGSLSGDRRVLGRARRGGCLESHEGVWSSKSNIESPHRYFPSRPRSYPARSTRARATPRGGRAGENAAQPLGAREASCRLDSRLRSWGGRQ